MGAAIVAPMTTPVSTLQFLRENAAYLTVGAMLSALSSFGQTFFISIFAGEIREAFDLSNGDWGLIYMGGTMVSAAVMVWAGGLADRIRVRVLGVAVVACLGLACFAMALNHLVVLLPMVIFSLRLMGQGMSMHVATVSMVRWFVATRGRALAVATMGFMTAEALLPLTFVWLKTHFDWRTLWIICGLVCLGVLPILHQLLKRERTPKSVVQSISVPGIGGRHHTRGEVLKDPLFWSTVPALMVFPAFGTAFWFHQVHFAEINGWSHLSLVAIFPLGTITFGLSTMLYGFAIDRFGSVRLMPIYLLPLVLAFTVHAFAPNVGWVAVGVVLMGLAGGGQSTLPNALWAELYGTAHVGAIKSAVAAFMVLGSAIGPGLSGWMIDAGIPYQTQLLWFAGSFAIASALMVVPVKNAYRALSNTP